MNTFSCFIIGDDNLTLHCAELLLAANHHLLGIISTKQHVQHWCDTHSIACIPSVHAFATCSEHQVFDYLFSIINKHLLPLSLLKRPKIHPINYHDSPLPKYAGLHATSWAILNGETEHAISWHIMDENIDTGAILKQVSFCIAEEDTAFSLNVKCYEQAVLVFQELIAELAGNNTTPRPQDAAARTYFGLNQKPNNWGFIAWNHSAQAIDRLYRGLTLGPHTNNLLATPKLILNDTVFIVSSLKKLYVCSRATPGTVVALSKNSLQIATATKDILILQLTDLQGQQQKISALISRFNLKIGGLLESVQEHFIEKISKGLGSERFWINALTNSIVDMPCLPQLTANSVYKKQRINLAQPLRQQVLVASVLLYFYRLNNYKNFTVTLTHSTLIDLSIELKQFIFPAVPLTTQFKSDQSVIDALYLVGADYDQLMKNKTYTSDLLVRYPELKRTEDFKLSIVLVDPEEPTLYPSTTLVTIYCFTDGSGYEVHHPSCLFFEQIEIHLLTLVTDIKNYPQKKIGELSYLSPEEHQVLRKDWNNTEVDFDVSKSLHYYFEAQVAKTPECIAAVYLDYSLSYAELNQKANHLAHYLRQLGIQANQLVGICLNRSLEMVISILAVLKAGAAYLPLDPNYPESRIAYMLDNSRCNYLILDQETLLSKPSSYQNKILEINSILNQSNLDLENLVTSVQPEDLAYVIYTSGSTGLPKGVAIPHKAICNHMLWMLHCYDFKISDVFLQKTPFSFDASVWEFFMPLICGATLVIAPADAHASPEELIHLVQKHQVSVLQLVPVMLQDILATRELRKCTSLRHVFCGGEILRPELSASFSKKHPTIKLHNLYGPTETTIDALTYSFNKENEPQECSFIGQPIWNTKVYVLDDQQQLLPVGLKGELYIAGFGLAKGYFNNIDATKASFLANPFDNNPANLLYKTGDLVQWNAKGILEYHGRCDDQVKIRGYRIELHEIESVLNRIRWIRHSLVVVETNGEGTVTLAAYLVLNEDKQHSSVELRKQLAADLPDFMIPNCFYIVDHLLTTPGGKIDKKNIPKPVKKLRANLFNNEFWNKTQQELRILWSCVLKLEEQTLGRDDNFFDLGGNSLSAMKLITLINTKFLIQLSLKNLFDSPTITSLSLIIESDNKALSSPIITLKAHGPKTPLFLVHPVGGGIFWYKNLGPYFDCYRPLYAIQDPGLEKQELLFKNLKEMASYYVKALQIIQPQGPYLLGGASFGSTVAIEMAKQLQDQGESIEAILSLDGWAYYPVLQHNASYFKQMMQEQNNRLLKNYMDHHLDGAKFLLELQWHREQMLTQYKLPKISAPFILFKAQEKNAFFPFDADLNWWEDYVLQPIQLHHVPGDHESMFAKDNSQILAAKINTVLNNLALGLNTLEVMQAVLL